MRTLANCSLFPIPIVALLLESSVLAGQLDEKESYMKPDQNNADSDELRPEYDVATLKGAVRGKYFERYKSGTNLARLSPEVRAAFPTDEAVNQALRSLMHAQQGS